MEKRVNFLIESSEFNTNISLCSDRINVAKNIHERFRFDCMRSVKLQTLRFIIDLNESYIVEMDRKSNKKKHNKQRFK